MTLTHSLIALLVVLVWGINFLFVSLGLQEVAPLQLCALRFFVASVPAIFFIKFPRNEWRAVFLYGFVMFAMQFGLLFMGMQYGMAAGIASLLIQVQVFFSVLFAVIFLKEQPNWGQIIGAIISFSGIGIVAMHFDKSMPLSGFLFIMAAAATWGVGNLITKKIKTQNMFSLIIWGSFVSCIPMALLSISIEGLDIWNPGLEQLGWKGITCILYIAFGSTWIGYGFWNWLITLYPVGMVAPFTLLVPIVAMFSSVLFLHESFEPWKLMASILVIGGLFINILGSKILTRRYRQQPVG